MEMQRFGVSSILLAVCLAASLLLAPSFLGMDSASAELKLPNYASGNADTQLEKSGKNITEWVLGAAVTILIIGIIWGAMQLGGDPEGGKQKILYSVVGLVVAASAYGIAKLAIG